MIFESLKFKPEKQRIICKYISHISNSFLNIKPINTFWAATTVQHANMRVLFVVTERRINVLCCDKSGILDSDD